MRTALCLSGKVGNTIGKSGYHKSEFRVLEKGYQHYKRHLLDKNNIDVFVHCWDTELSSEIEKLYSPIASVYQDQIKFKIPDYVKGESLRKQNHYSRWYSNMAVNNLKKEYENKNNFKYDFVMTTRFDLAWETDVVFSECDPSKFYAGNWSAVYDVYGRDLFKGGRGPLYDIVKTKPDQLKKLKYGLKGFPHVDEGFLDLWFFTNSELSDKFFDLYKMLDLYCKPGNCPTDSSDSISNHRLSKYHLENLGALDKLEFKYHMFDDFPEVRRKYFGCRK